MIAIIFGLAAPEDGNGLRKFAEGFDDARCFRQDEHQAVHDYFDAGTGPHILVAHSFGGDLAVQVARERNHTIEYLALLDPVSKLWPWTLGISACLSFNLSKNIQFADCWNRSELFGPPASRIRNPRIGWTNWGGWPNTSHASICADKGIRSKIIDGIHRALPPE